MVKQLEFDSSKQIYVKLGQILLFTNSSFFLSGNSEVSGVEETENQNENNSEIGNCMGSYVYAFMGLNYRGIKFHGHYNPQGFKLIQFLG